VAGIRNSAVAIRIRIRYERGFQAEAAFMEVSDVLT